MTIFTVLYAGKMPPKLSAAERDQFRAEAKKNAAASEIRSKKRHSRSEEHTSELQSLGESRMPSSA